MHILIFPLVHLFDTIEKMVGHLNISDEIPVMLAMFHLNRIPICGSAGAF